MPDGVLTECEVEPSVRDSGILLLKMRKSRGLEVELHNNDLQGGM